MDEKKPIAGRARKQIMTALLATIPCFTYGVQIGWLSPMSPLLKTANSTSPAHEPISDTTISYLATALPLSAILGIPFFSYSSDRYGRKISIIIISLLHCLSWAIKLASVVSPALISARIIAGLAAGGCFVVIPVYIKEIAEDTWRGALASLTMTQCKIGVIFVYAVGMAVSYRTNQAVYLTISVLHTMVFCFMPESPNYLLKIGKQKRAVQTISWLRSVHRTDDLVSQELEKLKEEQQRFNELPRVTLMSVVRDKASFSAVRMTMVLMAMQTLSGCFALMNYASTVFKGGSELSPNMLALFMGSLQLAGAFFTTVSIERFGRKIPLACSSLVVSICMTTVATCLVLHTEASWPRVAAVCVAVLAYGVGLAPVPMVVMAEVFTFQVRARMAGVSMAVSFFCSSMTVLFYSPISIAFGEHVVFYIFGAVTLLGAVYTVLWVPETKGKSLSEIQAFWKKPEPVFV